jgi:hypothetical protein
MAGEAGGGDEGVEITVGGSILIRQPPHHPGMDRRRFLLTSLAGAVTAPLAGEAQQARKCVQGSPRPTVGRLDAGA